MSELADIDISKPRWDQNTYIGRAKHFFCVTNPINIFASSKKLDEAREIITKHRAKEKVKISVEELWKAKQLYDSAHHPITGERQPLIGRMSAQVPMNMLVVGCMITFYKSTPAVIFWQWINQSFNALVNYVNRSDASMTPTQIGTAYVLATAGAVGTALGLNKALRKCHPLIRRFVPFSAVVAANCINIPIMRNKELREGIQVLDDREVVLGKSRVAAREATAQVVLSRVIMAAPYMLVTPMVVNHLETRRVFLKRPWLEPLVSPAVCGVILLFATPLACALFAQRNSITVERLEDEIKEAAKKMNLDHVYYNKGL